MNRKTLTLGMTAILIASMLAGAGTLAYFSDIETSTGNTFTTGTLDVKIRNGVGDYADDMGPLWDWPDLKPGDAINSRSWNFRNDGSIAIGEMKISCLYYVIESVEEPDTHNTASDPDSMAREFTITGLWVRKGGVPDTYILPLLSDHNNNGRPDLEDLKIGGVNGVTIVPDPNQGSITTVDMDMEFDSGASSNFQGDTLVLTMTFTFNQ